ncbi:MAG: DUF4827 domain-containing protein [Muribaculaceae bacterium]|nr:DUF4827 domain-containing protein [Muribaculaceae bacterium]
MRILRNIAAIVGCILMLASCDDDVSYAELLNKEDLAVNNFLADQIVYLDIPADTVFEVGPDAPYYRLDEDGQLYMQVLNAGTPGNKVRDKERIYFRFTRWALESYKDGKLPQGTGNNLSLSPMYFLYGNSNSLYLYGSGIQTPLEFLPIDCKVNLVVKSTVGMQEDQTSVIPYLYQLTYQRPM